MYFTGEYRKKFEEILITKKLNIFEEIPEIFLGDKKSSISHFANTFSEDLDLNNLKELLCDYKQTL